MFVFRLPLGFAVPHHKIAFDNVAVIAAAACERGLGERVVAVEWVLLLAVWAGRAAQWEQQEQGDDVGEKARQHQQKGGDGDADGVEHLVERDLPACAQDAARQHQLREPCAAFHQKRAEHKGEYHQAEGSQRADEFGDEDDGEDFGKDENKQGDSEVLHGGLSGRVAMGGK